MIRFRRILAFAAVALHPLMAQDTLISFDFSKPGSPESQSAAHLPDAAVHGDFTIPTAGIGDFGTSGHLVLPEFKAPTGPFTVEACFRLRNYGIDTSTYSSVLFNASVDGMDFSLRIGAGPRYPIRPGTDHVHPAIWAQSLDSSDLDRATVSSCVGALSMVGPSGRVLEAYTRSCLQLGEWIHLTATWDGEVINLYVNAAYETDTNRMMGLGSHPPQPDQIPIYIGARNGSGERHFDGEMAYVRVLNGALRGAEILRRFKETALAEDSAYDCQGAVTSRPIVLQGACDLSYSKRTLAANDSLAIQFSRDWDFKSLDAAYRVPVKFFRYFDHYNRVEAGNERLFWRAKIVRGPLPVPGETTPQIPSAIHARTLVWKGSGAIRVRDRDAGAPVLYSMKGARIPAETERIDGEWILRPKAAVPGLILMRRLPSPRL